MSDAIAEATTMAMRRDPTIFVMGVGVDVTRAGSSGRRALPGARRVRRDARVFDTPLSENCLTRDVAVGAAMTGMRPVLVHARVDFLLLTLDQLVNHAAKWSYMSGGALRVPMLVRRAVVGREVGAGGAALAEPPGGGRTLPGDRSDHAVQPGRREGAPPLRAHGLVIPVVCASSTDGRTACAAWCRRTGTRCRSERRRSCARGRTSPSWPSRRWSARRSAPPRRSRPKGRAAR